MKLVKAGSCSSIESIHASKWPVADVSNKTRCSLRSVELSSGVATTEPTSSNLDWIC